MCDPASACPGLSSEPDTASLDRLGAALLPQRVVDVERPKLLHRSRIGSACSGDSRGQTRASARYAKYVAERKRERRDDSEDKDENKVPPVTSSLITNVLQALRGLLLVPAALDQPLLDRSRATEGLRSHDRHEQRAG